MNTILPQLFEINDSINWKTYLDTEGYVVLKNILQPEEIEYALKLFKKDINKVSPKLDFDNNNTFVKRNVPVMYSKGVCVYNGLCQSDFMWNLRTNKNIKNIYERLFDSKDLVVSLDGFSLFLSNKQKSKPWLHIDQNPKNELYSIQGSYNFFKVDSDDAGFVVVPKSHINSNSYIDKYININNNDDWITFDYENNNFKELYDSCVKLMIPNNSFILWNSKTIHANEGFNKPYNELNRLTAYITFLETKYRNETILEERIKAYINGEGTSHWCNKCELKKYPKWFMDHYKQYEFNDIKPRINNDNDNIPDDRLELL